MKRSATLVLLAAGLAAIAAAASAQAGSSAPRATGVVVETKFPAAGELTVGSVAVRSKPALGAPRVAVMKYFRPDYRVQEILAVSSATAPNGTPWYRISVPG